MLKQSSVLVVGYPLVPVNGQSVATQAILDVLGRRAHFQPLDLRSWRGKIATHLKAARAIATTDCKHVYLTVNGRLGMALTTLLAAVARAAGRKLVLHHHSGSYIERTEVGVRILALVAGNGAVHLAQSPDMALTFTRRYGVAAAGFSNIGCVHGTPATARPNRSRIVLGHLSNLTRPKGTDTAIDTLRAGLAAGMDLKLTVAGPIHDAVIGNLLRSAACEFSPDRFAYVGPVYGTAKDAFYRDIDVFLFPSRYVSESQGIVNLEAMSYGVPTIATARGSVSRDVGDEGGEVVGIAEDYTAAALAYLRTWERRGCSQAAQRQFARLTRDHEAEKMALLRHFGHHVCVPTTVPSVSEEGVPALMRMSPVASYQRE